MAVRSQFAEEADANVVQCGEFTATWADEHAEHLGEVQHDVSKYVCDDIQRDTKPDIPRKTLTYPTTFPRTAAYRQLLNDDTSDWDREG